MIIVKIPIWNVLQKYYVHRWMHWTGVHIVLLYYRQTSPGGVRLSRAAILQKGIEYIAYLNEQSAKQQEQLESLKKEVTTLRIMKENYERITRAHQSSTTQGSSSSTDLQVPEELKFRVVIFVCVCVCVCVYAWVCVCVCVHTFMLKEVFA